MKKYLIAMGLMLAASTLTGCSKDGATDAAPDMPKQTVELRAPYAPYADQTRTTLDPTTGKVSWATGDKLAVWVAETGTTPSAWTKSEFTVSDTKQGIFQGQVSLEEGKSYDWYVGTSNYFLNAPDGSDGSFQLGNQTTESYMDNVAAADLLYGVAENVPAGTMPEVTLKHAGTLMKIIIKNGETNDIMPTSIEFSAPNDTYIGGRILPNFKTGTYTFDNAQSWNTSTLTVKNSEAIGTGESYEYCMVMLPFELQSGDEFGITVNTNKGTSVQTRTMESDIEFAAGTMNTATFHFTLPEAAEATYTLVTDVAKLTEGSEILIVSTTKESEYVTMGSKHNNYYNPINVTVSDDQIVNPSATARVLTVGKDSDLFTLTDTADNGKYLCAIPGENYMRTESTLSDNSRWTITIDESSHEAAITTNNSSEPRWIQYNLTSPRFSCYKTSTTNQGRVTIYKKN